MIAVTTDFLSHSYISAIDLPCIELWIENFKCGASYIFSDHSKKHKKSGKGWSRKFNRPIYNSHSDDSDSKGTKLPRPKAIERHKDDGLEDYFLDRMEWVLGTLIRKCLYYKRSGVNC